MTMKTKAKTTMKRFETFHGYCNVAYFCGPTAEGYTVVFPSREERDRALEELRDAAIDNGLGVGAARAGIYPVIRRIDVSTHEGIAAMEEIGLGYSVRMEDGR